MAQPHGGLFGLSNKMHGDASHQKERGGGGKWISKWYGWNQIGGGTNLYSKRGHSYLSIRTADLPVTEDIGSFLATHNKPFPDPQWLDLVHLKGLSGGLTSVSCSKACSKEGKCLRRRRRRRRALPRRKVGETTTEEGNTATRSEY